jgi:hypothetical protein
VVLTGPGLRQTKRTETNIEGTTQITVWNHTVLSSTTFVLGVEVFSLRQLIRLYGAMRRLFSRESNGFNEPHGVALRVRVSSLGKARCS